MRRSVGPKKNVSVAQKANPSQGYRRFKALREFMRKERNADGSSTMISRPMWVDLVNRKKYPATEDWNNSPPDLASGDAANEPRCKPPSQAYRENYAKIDWER